MANAVETREREFHFTDADFERVRKLIYKHAGISLAPIKRDMVYSRLARRLRARGTRPSASTWPTSKPTTTPSGKPSSIR
jgi:chemotaxis protein methyltransferase CheR